MVLYASIVAKTRTYVMTRRAPKSGDIGRAAGHDGLMAAGRKGNEAVAPPIIDMGITTEGRQPGGLVRAGHKGSEAAAPPRLCR